MVVVVLPPVVLAKKNAFNGISVFAGDGIFEVDAVVDSAMLVTQRTDIVVRTPAITNDLCAGFDPVTYNGSKVCRRFCPGREREMFFRTHALHRQTLTDP